MAQWRRNLIPSFLNSRWLPVHDDGRRVRLRLAVSGDRGWLSAKMEALVINREYAASHWLGHMIMEPHASVNRVSLSCNGLVWRKIFLTELGRFL